MFVFSRKLLWLLVVIVLVVGDDHHSANGLSCWKCNKADAASGSDDLCDADHSGEAIECGDGTTHVCALKQLRGRDEYRKYCAKAQDFGDKYNCDRLGNRDPILVCYCKTDLCNKEKSYGMDTPGGTPGGGGNDAKGDSVGTKGTFSTCVLGLLAVIIAASI